MDVRDAWNDQDLDEVFAFYTSFTTDTLNTPRDITGLTASAGMQRIGSADAPITFTMATGLSIENTNQVVLHVPAATVAAWVLGQYQFDLVLVDGSGHRMSGDALIFDLKQGYAP